MGFPLGTSGHFLPAFAGTSIWVGIEKKGPQANLLTARGLIRYRSMVNLIGYLPGLLTSLRSRRRGAAGGPF